MARRCQTKAGDKRCERDAKHPGQHQIYGYSWEDGGEPEMWAATALAARGYTHRPTTDRTAAMGAHDIIDESGNVVAIIKAHQVWRWLEGRDDG